MAVDMKPRGLMLIHNFRPGPTGGAEIQAERLAYGLAGLGHLMQVLTNPISVVSNWNDFGDELPNAPEEEVFYGPGTDTSATAYHCEGKESCNREDAYQGVRIHRPSFSLAYEVNRGVADTFRYLVKNRGSYDVLHCHMAYGHAVVATVVARSFNKRCILKIACAGEYGEFRAFSKFPGFSKALKILHQADAIVSISSEVERELLAYGFVPERIVRIPNGVDTHYFRRSLPFPQRDPTRFVLMGRKHPQKGIDIALQAMRMLHARGFEGNIEMYLYGEEYPQHDYRAMADRLNLSNFVHFHLFEKDILSVYQSNHCLLLPSRGEGLSNALLEAMSLEMPVIATAVSGTPDVVDDGLDAILIPPDSPEALANAMARIVQDPVFAHQLGQNARRKIEGRYSLEIVARQYSQLYDRLCNDE
jgi:glycosyltransferase involved in cell wall biosynthesis